MAGVETRLRFYQVEELVHLPATHPDRVAIEEMARQAAELNLYELWLDQAQKYIDLGFHTERGLTEEQYLASLPEFRSQPPEYKGRLDVPLLVETRIPWEKQAERASIGISGYLMTIISKTHEWEGNHSQTLDVPYTGWFNNWGQRFAKEIRPFDARAQLAPDESGAGPFEGIALQIHHPEITSSGKYFDLIGYSVGSSGILRLLDWHGRPVFSADLDINSNPDFRPLVRGTKIVTK